MTRTMIAAFLLAGVSTAALAQEHRHAGTHVHGLAELAVALNPDGTLVAEMESPLYNLIGFERAPRNASEAGFVASALVAIEEQAWPAFNAEAGCVFAGLEVSGFPPADAPEDSDAHGAHGDNHAHGHDHSHDHAHHDHDDHEHGDHEHGGEGHGHSHDGHDHGHDHDHGHGHGQAASGQGYSDAFISWSFTCSAPERLTGVDAAALFEAFERLERVDVQFFDGTRAASQTLTATASRLTIR